MSRRAESQPSPAVALRHVLTWTAGGRQGDGVQSLAWAVDLERGRLLRPIEELVESYQSASEDEPPCLQLLPVPQTEAYALTVFTPLGKAPDGREGNFWAETLVVPGSWLAQGDWDAAAAFAALTWWGPESARESLRQDLEPEPLPALAAGPLERLGRLVEAVPRDHLWPLLLAVIQQSHGLRPVRLLEADRGRAGELEDVVMQLPLVVPPPYRLVREAGRERCLSLRTRSPARGMAPRADITGFPPAAMEAREADDGVVVDLSGRIKPPSSRDTFGTGYARWLHGMLEAGAWGAIARLYEKARSTPAGNFFVNFKSLADGSARGVAVPARLPERLPGALEGPPEEVVAGEAQRPAPAAGGGGAGAAGVQASFDELGPAAQAAPADVPPAAPRAVAAAGGTPEGSAVATAQAGWARRSQVEGEVWEGYESYRTALDQLVAELRDDLARDFETRAAELRRQVMALREAQDGKLDAISRDLKDAEKRSRQKGDSLGKESDDRTAKLAAHARRLTLLEKRVKLLAQSGGAAGVAAAGDLLPEDEPPEGSEPSERLVGVARPGWAERLRDWLAENRPLVASVAASVVLVALAVPALWLWSKRRPQEARPPTAETARREAAALVRRVTDGAVAAAALGFAAGQEESERVAQEIAALALSHGVRIDGMTECALLQAGLRRQEPGIEVDGRCGQGTTGALVNSEMDPCCRAFQRQGDAQAVDRLGNCFVADQLRRGWGSEQGQGGSEACDGESPWRAGRSWTANETAAALALFSQAATAVDATARPDLAQALRDLDPLASPQMRQSLAGKTLTDDQAERVLELVWAIDQRRDEPEALEELSLEEIRQLDAFVDAASAAQGAGGLAAAGEGGRR